MKNEIKVYMYVSDFNWEEDTKKKLLDSFKDFDVTHDKKAAIGAGASGPLPELNILIDVQTALGTAIGVITGGFLVAIGEDTWNALKKALKSVKDIKPDKMDPSLPKEMKFPLKSEIIWWNHFTDISFLVHLPTANSQEFEEALDKLPEAIDIAVKTDKNFSRLIWNNGEWKAI